MSERVKSALWLVLVLAAAAVVLLTVRVEKVHAQVPTRTLVWTVPQGVQLGATYEMRLSRTPIAGVDTLSWWNAAGVVSGLPVPGAVGSTDSTVVSPQLYGQTYYVAIRTCNVGPACSFFSNISIFTTPAPPPSPPWRIIDLRTRP